jgi:hypothetical protein
MPCHFEGGTVDKPHGKLNQKEDAMFLKKFVIGALLAVTSIGFTPVCHVEAAEPMVIGIPTSTGFLEGKEALKAVKLAVAEINAHGGVDVGGTKRPFAVESVDIRDAAPGVPVPEALLGLEKIILEKKPAALVVGPFSVRSPHGGNGHHRQITRSPCWAPLPCHRPPRPKSKGTGKV